MFYAQTVTPSAPASYSAPPGCVLTIRTAALMDGSPPARLLLTAPGLDEAPMTALIATLRPWRTSETVRLDQAVGFQGGTVTFTVVAADEPPAAAGNAPLADDGTMALAYHKAVGADALLLVLFIAAGAPAGGA